MSTKQPKKAPTSVKPNPPPPPPKKVTSMRCASCGMECDEYGNPLYPSDEPYRKAIERLMAASIEIERLERELAVVKEDYRRVLFDRARLEDQNDSLLQQEHPRDCLYYVGADGQKHCTVVEELEEAKAEVLRLRKIIEASGALVDWFHSFLFLAATAGIIVILAAIFRCGGSM